MDPSTMLGVGLALLAFSAPLTAAIYSKMRVAPHHKVAPIAPVLPVAPVAPVLPIAPLLDMIDFVKFREFADFREEVRVNFAEIKSSLAAFTRAG